MMLNVSRSSPAGEEVNQSPPCSRESADNASYSSDVSSDSETSSDEEWETFRSARAADRASALSAVEAMKEMVGYFYHPEKPVPNGLQARCFFDRASAPERESTERGEEREEALQAVADMKETVGHFYHPERPVPNGLQSRCFFDRASAPERESKERGEEREEALQAVADMKETVGYFYHPERPVPNGLQARCFFDRASAPERESRERVQEREEALQAVADMKEMVGYFYHPERPVPNGLQARCFFDRASAPQPSAPTTPPSCRPRGESAADRLFAMDGDTADASPAATFDSSLVVFIDEEQVGQKDGVLSKSPSSVALFDQA